MAETKFAFFALLFQAVLILLLGLFVEYKSDVVWEPLCRGLNQTQCEQPPFEDVECLWDAAETKCLGGSSSNEIYPFFQDVHVMIFIG